MYSIGWSNGRQELRKACGDRPNQSFSASPKKKSGHDMRVTQIDREALVTNTNEPAAQPMQFRSPASVVRAVCMDRSGLLSSSTDSYHPPQAAN
jgi:hypothetical protein